MEWVPSAPYQIQTGIKSKPTAPARPLNSRNAPRWVWILFLSAIPPEADVVEKGPGAGVVPLLLLGPVLIGLELLHPPLQGGRVEVDVHHSCRYIFVPQQTLHLRHVHAVGEPCGRGRVAQQVGVRGDGDEKPGSVMSGSRRRSKGVLGVGPTGRGRFKNAEPTIWRDEDLDVPTFIRKNLNLDF